MKGHKKAISALTFNNEGTQLVSGSNDCTIVIWDLIGETGICRLKGHRDMVTSVLLIEEYNMLLSASKDTLLKVWSIDGQYCMDTYIGHRTEIWSMTKFSQSGFKETENENALSQYLILTGSSDQSLRLFNVFKEPRVLKTAQEGEKTRDESSTLEVTTSGLSAARDDMYTSEHVLEYRGCVTVPKNGRTGQLMVDPSGELVGYYVCYCTRYRTRYYCTFALNILIIHSSSSPFVSFFCICICISIHPPHLSSSLECRQTIHALPNSIG